MSIRVRWMRCALLSMFSLTQACASQFTFEDADPDAVKVSDVRALLRGDGSEFEPVGTRSRSAALTNDALALATPNDTGVTCCSDGDCVCRGANPSLTTLESNGPFRYGSYSWGFPTWGYGGGTIFYPTNAEGPYSAVVMCPGFTAAKSSIEDWGPFFA
jgi:hypothetical protein